MSDVTAGAQSTTDAGAPGGATSGSGTQPAPTAEGRTLTQEQFNAAIAEEKRKWKQQQDEAAAKLKREADEKAAAARGEWEKVATERAAERDKASADLTSANERLAALTAAMEAQIKERARALPDELRALIPDDADVLTRYGLVTKAAAAAEKLQVQRTPGTPSGPKGNGGSPSGTTTPADLLARKRAAGGYDL